MEKQSLPPLPMVHSDLDEYGTALTVTTTGSTTPGVFFQPLIFNGDNQIIIL